MPTYHIGIIYPHCPGAILIDFLMALVGRPHRQRSINMHKMTCEIQTDQALEQYTPVWIGNCQKHQKTRGSTSVDCHIKHGAELRGLVEFAR